MYLRVGEGIRISEVKEGAGGSIPSFLTHTRGERWQIGKSSQTWQDLRAKGFVGENNTDEKSWDSLLIKVHRLEIIGIMLTEDIGYKDLIFPQYP